MQEDQSNSFLLSTKSPDFTITATENKKNRYAEQNLIRIFSIGNKKLGLKSETKASENSNTKESERLKGVNDAAWIKANLR